VLIFQLTHILSTGKHPKTLLALIAKPHYLVSKSKKTPTCGVFFKKEDHFGNKHGGNYKQPQNA
jgi:hypothetical protein